MFLCLLVYQLKNWLTVLTALMAAVVATLWYLCIPGDSYIVAAAVIAATGGYFLKRREERKQ